MPHVATSAVRRSCSPYKTIHNFSHFAQRGQTVAGVRVWPFKAMHGAGPASTFT